MRSIVVVLLSISAIAYGASITPYVIGGNNAKDGEYPYMVSVQDSDDYSHICGGSILNKRWVLTAAFCVYELEPIDLLIRAGSVMVDVDHGQQYFVESRYVHEDFDEYEKNHNNVALIQIVGEFNFANPLIKPVVLSEDYLQPDVDVTSMGWGMYDVEGYKWPENLQIFNARVAPNELCQWVEGAEYGETEMCVYNGEDSGNCHNDGGNPLMVKGTNVQVGIAEDFHCSKGKSPGKRYTRVDSYINWVHEHTDSWDV